MYIEQLRKEKHLNILHLIKCYLDINLVKMIYAQKVSDLTLPDHR